MPVVIGNAMVNILFSATVKDFIPEGKTGLFQGIRMIFFVLIPMVVGPVIGDYACRSAGATYTQENIVAGEKVITELAVPDAKMFLYSAVVAALVFIPLLLLKKRGLDKATEEK